MANTIILKQSSVAAKIPLAGDLALGELAVNTADGIIYLKKGDGTVIDVGGQAPVSSVDSRTGVVTLSDLYATTAQGTLADDALPATNGVSTGLYETIITVPALNIDVSASNVQTKTISVDSTFTFSGWTTNSSSVTLELTTLGTEVVTFTGVTFKEPIVLAVGLNVIVFTSTDNGTTVNGYIARDGA